MKIPKTTTEKEFTEAMDKILPRIKNKYFADGYTGEDISQEAYIIGLKALSKYRPECGPLLNYLSVVVENRVKNIVRNKNFQSTKLTISSIDEVNEEEIKTVNVTHNEQEFWDIIDEQLPIEFRLDYLKFKQGIYLTKVRRLALIEELKKIVEPII